MNLRSAIPKTFVCLSALLLAGGAFAEDLTFKIEKKEVAFKAMPEKHITISANCVHDGRLQDCAASQALKAANMAKLGRDLFGRNPGALLCSDQLGGRVVWTRNHRGDERTFCEFKDGSYVGSGALAFYGRENSKKK